jgi:lipoate-protein ligase A
MFEFSGNEEVNYRIKKDLECRNVYYSSNNLKTDLIINGKRVTGSGYYYHIGGIFIAKICKPADEEDAIYIN